MARMRVAAIRYLTYPVIVLGGAALLVSAAAMEWSYWPFGPAILAACALAVALLERVQPYVAAWNVDDGDAGVDALHLIGNIAVSHLSLLAFAVLRSLWPGTGVWPAHWPFWAEALLALGIIDLGLYFVHRASHGVGWLWRLHSIHHSPRRVYWMDGQRRHLVHEVIEGTPGLLVLFVVGAPTNACLVAVAMVTLHLMLQHANIDYRVGPFRVLFAVAELHRWHHQRRWRDVQGNYGGVFAVWDRVFRTALLQRGDAASDVGMDDEPDLPADYIGQLAWPFARRSTP
jgi:sterol desaturase/sphingolipid hydroxylase (fatty acid hydroxylase superfamily)